MYHPELTTEFPEVDFTTLDRLYLPAGDYRSVLLGGLPERSAERPLVITNRGGQVRVGGDAANYVFAINGSSNWVLTGRYDEAAETGDAEFRGHAEGDFAHSQGSYGIFIDDAFSKEGLSGLAIGGGATDFELDMLEVTRAEFAGIVAKTDNDGNATMRNVRVHDLYPVEFRDFMNEDIDANVRRVEWWTDRATLHPDQPVVSYEAGAYVMHQGTLYRATTDNEEAPPDSSPEVWEALPPPADDVRLSNDSPHAGLGLRWPPP